MSHVSTITPTVANPFSISALPEPVEITLQGVIVERDTLFVFLAVEEENYIFEPPARALIPFSSFQKYLVEKLNVLVSHESQRAPNQRRRKYEWRIALQDAFDRGMKK